ncbi:MAG: glycosyltransferase family 2 protein [Gemmatimonadaceae bacterium]
MTNSRVPITVVIPTLNEGARLGAALESVRWADDVIVVDGGSADDTVGIADRSGARTMVVPGRTIGAQRNAGLEVAKHEWVLALDADESVTPELQESLRRLSEGSVERHASFRVRSRNWHLGRELRHGPWGNDWKIRVLSRGERFTESRVHENLVSQSDVGTISGELIHHPYEDLAHQVVKIAKYAQWAALDMQDRGRTASIWAMLTHPAVRFVRDYLVLGGWRDGVAGFIVSTTSAFSVFCKYASFLVAQRTVVSEQRYAAVSRLRSSARY